MPKTVDEILREPDYGSTHRAWIVEATDEQLDEYIMRISGYEKLHRMASSEREKRHFNHLNKPHWTLTPTFGISVGIFIISGLILAVAVLSWMFPREPRKEIPISQPATVNQSTSTYIATSVSAPTNSPPMKAVIQQTPSPAIYELPHTNILGH
jgi:hypothetical protein